MQIYETPPQRIPEASQELVTALFNVSPDVRYTWGTRFIGEQYVLGSYCMRRVVGESTAFNNDKTVDAARQLGTIYRALGLALREDTDPMAEPDLLPLVRVPLASHLEAVAQDEQARGFRGLSGVCMAFAQRQPHLMRHVEPKTDGFTPFDAGQGLYIAAAVMVEVLERQLAANEMDFEVNDPRDPT